MQRTCSERPKVPGAVFSKEGVAEYGKDVHTDEEQGKDIGHV